MASSLPATVPTTGGLSVEGASAPLLDELLKDLAAELRKQGVPLDQLLRPPAPPQMVRERFAEIGLRAPDEAVTLYGWCDGFKSEGSVLPLPVFEILPLEGMVCRLSFTTKLELRRALEGWPRGWYGAPATNCSGTYRPLTDDFPTNCDEFPFHSTVEGGPGASLLKILGTDNQKQGNQLGQFYQACESVGSPTASNSNEFVVVPNAGSPSVGICGLD